MTPLLRLYALSREGYAKLREASSRLRASWDSHFSSAWYRAEVAHMNEIIRQRRERERRMERLLGRGERERT